MGSGFGRFSSEGVGRGGLVWAGFRGAAACGLGEVFYFWGGDGTCVGNGHSSWLDGFGVVVVMPHAGAVLEWDILLVKIWCGVCVHSHIGREKNVNYTKNQI